MAAGRGERACERRVVLLGASNAARGLSMFVETARAAWGKPLDILAAVGDGRSYGMASCVLGRTLPGILECGLWSEWEQRPPLPTAGLLTDIGNDLAFGSSPPIVARWVEEALRRMRDRCERLAITELPLESIRSLGPLRFGLMRRLLFPRSRLTLAGAIAGAEELNDRVHELAAGYGAEIVRQPGEWYGLDPIHIPLRHRRTAWREFLRPWSEQEFAAARGSLLRWLYLRTRRPQRRWLLGIEQRREQPCTTLADDSRMSFY